MELQPQQRVELWDGQNRYLGEVVIGRIEKDLVFGEFVPGPGYAELAPLFRDYVEAANEQLLGIVGQLDAVIGRLGLNLRSALGPGLPAIHDVQIGAGTITFRTLLPPVDSSESEPSSPPETPAPALPPHLHSV